MAVTVLIAALTFMCLPAFAQCPLCKIAVENSSQAAKMSKGLNLGILVLLVPPVTVFCSIFILAVKHRNTAKS